MDPPSQSDAKLSAENQEEETRCITTRVAKIRFTGVIAADDDQQCYSSDEEVVEALSLCNNSPDTSRKQFFFLIDRIVYQITILFTN